MHQIYQDSIARKWCKALISTFHYLSCIPHAAKFALIVNTITMHQRSVLRIRSGVDVQRRFPFLLLRSNTSKMSAVSKFMEALKQATNPERPPEAKPTVRSLENNELSDENIHPQPSSSPQVVGDDPFYRSLDSLHHGDPMPENTHPEAEQYSFHHQAGVIPAQSIV